MDELIWVGLFIVCATAAFLAGKWTVRRSQANITERHHPEVDKEKDTHQETNPESPDPKPNDLEDHDHLHPEQAELLQLTDQLVQLQALLKLNSVLASSLDLDHVLNQALSIMNEIVNGEASLIYLLSANRDRLVLRAAVQGSKSVTGIERQRMNQQVEAAAQWAIENRRVLLIKNVEQDDQFHSATQDIVDFESLLFVPVLNNDELQGAMGFLSTLPHAFQAEDVRLLTNAATQIGVTVTNAELYRLIRDQAERLGNMLRAQHIEASKSRAILEAIGDGVVVTDTKQRIVLFNTAASKIFGVQQEHILNQSVVNFIGNFGTAGAQMADAVNYWSTKAEGSTSENTLSDRLVLDDKRVISFNSAPVLIGDEFLGTVSIFRDITREVELDRLKSEFVATVSHELRTPMTSIKGYVEILLSEAAGSLNEGQKRFLEVVDENTSRLGTLVNDLLDISRIEAGRAELFIEPFNILELLEDAQKYVEQRSQEDDKAMSVSVYYDPDLSPMVADKDRIRQVIFNLVDNSFNYTPAGGEIAISACQVGEEIEIGVSDTGIGIPPEDLELVFERFYRGEQALDMGVHGTGLGLSIVTNYVEMHGGKLWAESEGIPGQGSRFVFTLPVSAHSPKPTEA